MRRLCFLVAIACGLAASRPATALDCANGDPALVTARANGDFEYTVDPDDPAHDALYVNHLEDGPSKIVVAHVDGRTAQIVPGSLTTIANNFNGMRAINGPEFVHPPHGGLGVLYRALDGVHGVFRRVAPNAWNEFNIDVNGKAAGSAPPRLASSYNGSYEAGGLPFDQDTFTLAAGPCKSRCFASMHSGVPTDPTLVMAQVKLTIPPFWLVQGTRDGVIYFKACTRNAAANGSCALYEATIDGAGGFKSGSMHLLAAVAPQMAADIQTQPMATAVHPTTGTTVLFVAGSHASGQTIDVYEQKLPGAPLALVGSVPAERNDHYRVIDDGSLLLLHYLVRHGSHAGSYTLTVTAAGSQLQVNATKQITAAANGAEVEYFPATRRFAIFYRTSQHPSLLQRCFFDP